MCHFLFHGCSSSPWRKHQVYSTFHSMKWLLWCCDMKFVWARMLSFLLMLNTFGYGPELFWIRIWIFFHIFGYFLDTNGYFHFGYARFFGCGVLGIFFDTIAVWPAPDASTKKQETKTNFGYFWETMAFHLRQTRTISKQIRKNGYVY